MKLRQSQDIFIPVIFGIGAFFLVVGPWMLNPQNVSWIHGLDPQQHYWGWVFFRQGPWSFPIGMNPDYGLSIASSIAFSDSIPLLAFIFKPFSSILPETFQYLGIWTLICFILQACFAWMIVGLFSRDRWIKFFSMGLLVFAPTFFFRIAFHTSLLSQFFLLAAIYLIFTSKKNQRILWWGFVLAISAMVHFYLFLILLILWLADLIDRTFINKELIKKNAIKEILIITSVLFFIFWQTGYLIAGKSFSVESAYGLHSLDPLAIFSSAGWSYILKELPILIHSYEGFVYLGLGGILLILFSLPILFSGKSQFFSHINRHPFLLLCLFCLLIFSITNDVKIGGFIWKYEIAPSILNRLNILRASARMFWPILYLIIVTSLFLVIKGYPKRTAIIILGLLFFIQVADTSAGWLPMRKKIHRDSTFTLCQNEINYLPLLGSNLQDPFWAEAGKKYKKLVLAPLVDAAWQWNWTPFAALAAKNHMATNGVYLARIDGKKVGITNNETKLAFSSRIFDAQSLYVVKDELLPLLISHIDPKIDLLTRINGINVFAPGWKLCEECAQDIPALNLFDLLTKSRVGFNIPFGDKDYENFLGAPQAYIPFDCKNTLKPQRINQFNFKKRESLLTSGWFRPEEWGVWAEEESAGLILPLPDKRAKSIEINARAFVNQRHPIQRVSIWADGVFIKQVVLSKGDQNLIDIPVPSKSLNLGYVNLEFQFLDRIRPKDISDNSDDRYLSMGLVSAKFK